MKRWRVFLEYDYFSIYQRECVCNHNWDELYHEHFYKIWFHSKNKGSSHILFIFKLLFIAQFDSIKILPLCYKYWFYQAFTEQSFATWSTHNKWQRYHLFCFSIQHLPANLQLALCRSLSLLTAETAVLLLIILIQACFQQTFLNPFLQCFFSCIIVCHTKMPPWRH